MNQMRPALRKATIYVRSNYLLSDRARQEFTNSLEVCFFFVFVWDNSADLCLNKQDIFDCAENWIFVWKYYGHLLYEHRGNDA